MRCYQEVRLGLNCIGGKETSLMASLLGHNAHLVSYGAMSKQPLSLPTSLFIFKNLTSHGFWQSRWYTERTRQDREKLMTVLASLMSDGKVTYIMWLSAIIELADRKIQLTGPEHEIVTLGVNETDEAATAKISDIFSKILEGRYGKKVLLKIEEPAD
jgi:trans-2-enoyl-CoA reductase